MIKLDRLVKMAKKKNTLNKVLCWRFFIYQFVIVLLFSVNSEYGQTSEIDSTETVSLEPEVAMFLENLKNNPDVAIVKSYRNKIEGYLEGTKRRYGDAEKELKKMDEAFGEIQESSTAEESNGELKNSVLAGLKEKKEVEVATLKLHILDLEGALKTIDSYIRRVETKSLFFRDDGFIKTAISWGEKQQIFSSNYTETNPKYFNSLFSIPAIIILVLLILTLIEGTNNYISQNISRENSIFLAVHYFSSLSSFSRLTIIILSLGSIAAVFFQPVFSQKIFIHHSVLLFFCWYAMHLFLLLIATKYDAACKDVMAIDEKMRRRSPLFHLFTLWSALLIMVSYDFLAPFFTPDFFNLVNSSLRIGWLLLLGLVLRKLCRKSEYSDGWRQIRLVLLVMVASLIILQFVGFNALVFLVLSNSCKTAILFILLFLSLDFVDFIVQFLHKYSEKMVSVLGLDSQTDSAKISSTNMLSIGAKALLLAVFLLLVCQVWNITNFKDGRLLSIIMDGVSLGGLNISPSRIILAFVIFALGWPLVSFSKPLIEIKWLIPSSVSENSRETFLTLIGYLGYVVVILAALSIAGIQLTGLTVIIGALSLGIGFGLQNIINNFISGLILMFERPIKKGDWIQVGTTEGYVKRITIRSTIIQTFDRSDVIVPNSELIANQVTNMMLYDHQGRLRVSVGVAYGSNTKLVKEILLAVADKHPQVIINDSTPAPRVLFQEFGDSSLNFDLLCHLKDVDQKLQVRSEMHFAIDSAFRENGIEIPFPQRDIHIRSQPPTNEKDNC